MMPSPPAISALLNEKEGTEAPRRDQTEIPTTDIAGNNTLRVAYVDPRVVRNKESHSHGTPDISNAVSGLSSLEKALSGPEESNQADLFAPSNVQLETDKLVITEKVRLPETISASRKTAAGRKLMTDSRKAAPKTTAIRVLRPYKQMFGLQFYVTPTVSYRRLSGHGIRTFNAQSGNYNYSGDVNSVVDHRPMIGTEAGMALVFSMNKKLRFKTGLQFNFTQYEANAYRYTAEIVPMTASGLGHSQINAVSTFRSTSGLSQTSLRNQRMMISIPIGAELSVVNKKNVQFNIGGSIQPTYVVNNQSYMISSDLKNYAQAPALYRHFNMNGALEAFISFRTGSTKWNAGPQLRYQMLSSYKAEYPISEHIIDYGFKIGMTKTLK